MADETRRSARHAELAAFLRAQRARLRPADVGLPEDSHPGRRRTPGLRREEVAEIAGVSVTWYTWLEQGRNISASEQVLDALARALRLDRDQQLSACPGRARHHGRRDPGRGRASTAATVGRHRGPQNRVHL